MLGFASQHRGEIVLGESGYTALVRSLCKDKSVPEIACHDKGTFVVQKMVSQKKKNKKWSVPVQALAIRDAALCRFSAMHALLQLACLCDSPFQYSVSIQPPASFFNLPTEGCMLKVK